MADAKITALTELTSVTNSDLLAVVDDPGGTPITKKATVGNVMSASGLVLTLPQINDTSSDHQYVFGVSELTADRTVTLPLLTGNDEFVFKDHTQTLTNKTLTSPVLNTSFTGTAKATGAEINTGTEDTKVVTPKAIADSAVSTASKTETLTNKTLTSPKINEDVALTATATELNASSGFYNSLSRQAIINGNFDVWQRGTSVAMTADNAYTADRWYCETATAGTDKTVSREDGTGVNGSYYCARVKMVSDVDELLTFSQALESQDSIKFRGKKVTLSFYARGGAEFVADNPTLVSKIATGKGTNQKVLAFTTLADGVAQNNTLTTSWQKFTCTTTNVIASDITQIGVSFAFTHAGSGTTTNYFEITQVQLCAGDVALPFMPKSYEEELRACQRYCFVPDCSAATSLIGIGSAASTTIIGIKVKLPVTMRTAPTITATATDFFLSDGVGAGIDLSSIALFSATKDLVEIDARVASGLTQYRFYTLFSDATANRILVLSAEL
jgi:hypothetical protein